MPPQTRKGGRDLCAAPRHALSKLDSVGQCEPTAGIPGGPGETERESIGIASIFLTGRGFDGPATGRDGERLGEATTSMSLDACLRRRLGRSSSDSSYASLASASVDDDDDDPTATGTLLVRFPAAAPRDGRPAGGS